MQNCFHQKKPSSVWRIFNNPDRSLSKARVCLPTTFLWNLQYHNFSFDYFYTASPNTREFFLKNSRWSVKKLRYRSRVVHSYPLPSLRQRTTKFGSQKIASHRNNIKIRLTLLRKVHSSLGVHANPLFCLEKWSDDFWLKQTTISDWIKWSNGFWLKQTTISDWILACRRFKMEEDSVGMSHFFPKFDVFRNKNFFIGCFWYCKNLFFLSVSHLGTQC